MNQTWFKNPNMLMAALALKVDELENEVSELTTENKILEVDVLIKARVIKQLEAQLHGTRQHVTEVNQDG